MLNQQRCCISLVPSLSNSKRPQWDRLLPLPSFLSRMPLLFLPLASSHSWWPSCWLGLTLWASKSCRFTKSTAVAHHAWQSSVSELHNMPHFLCSCLLLKATVLLYTWARKGSGGGKKKVQNIEWSYFNLQRHLPFTWSVLCILPPNCPKGWVVLCQVLPKHHKPQSWTVTAARL